VTLGLIYSMDSLVYHTTDRIEKTGLIIDTKVYVDLKDGVTVYQYLYRGPEVISTSCVQLPFIEFGRFITSVGGLLVGGSWRRSVNCQFESPETERLDLIF